MPSHSWNLAGLDFRRVDHGWTADIPPALGSFQGHPVRIMIGTRVLAHEPKELPDPSDDQIRLGTFLIENLSEVLFQCALRLRSYCEDPSFFPEMVPELWIPSAEESHGPMSWTMVVERRDDEEDGYHIEFDGLEFIQIFSYEDTYD